MASYFSSLTTSYSTLRRFLPTTLSEETDLTVATEADSHVSRVLRAYYTEKGRPFPPWLGPDPNAPVKQITTPALTTTQRPTSTTTASSTNSRTSGLNDLFGESSPTAQQAENPNSLRAARRPARSPGIQSNSSASSMSTTSNPYASERLPAPSSQPLQVPSARPLPSQRAGSYQTRGATPPQQPQSKEMSAQERLKARLGGGPRAGSTEREREKERDRTGGDRDIGRGGERERRGGGSGGSGLSAFNPYETSGLAGLGSGFNPYEASGGSPYADTSRDGGRDGGRSNSGQRGAYVRGANPWDSGDSGGGLSPAPASRGERRGPGLPVSPRGPRR